MLQVSEAEVRSGPVDAQPRPGSRASILDLTFALWVVAIPLAFHNRILNGDGDLARHIVTGRHILEHGPRFADPFSFTRPGEPFLAYEWLTQVLYALAHQAAGLPGALVLATLVIASALTLVVAYVRKGGDPWLAFMTGIVAAVLSAPHWLARPHLFSFLGLAILLHVLESRRRWWLVPLFAIWVNLHPGFLYGLVMILVWSMGKWLDGLRTGERVRWRELLPLFGIAAVATLLNPFGWTLHWHAITLVNSDLARSIEEFMPLAVVSGYGAVVMSVTFLVVLCMAGMRSFPGWTTVLVYGVAFYAALATIRYGAMISFFALPIAARSFVPLARELPRWLLGKMRAEFARSDIAQWRFAPVAGALLLMVVGVGAAWPAARLLPARFSAEVFPRSALDRVPAASAGGRMFVEYLWGGYVLYSWPGQRVFIDSMADFYGHDILLEYGKIKGAEDGWEESLEKWQVTAVLLPPDADVVDELRENRDWRVAFEDDVAVLFVRGDAARAGTEVSLNR